MSDAELAAVLARDEEVRTVTAFPDGSVDVYYSVCDIEGGRIENRRTFADRPVDHPKRETGAGDQFGAGLAHALARGWDWGLALALGNACGSYYVETARTADSETLRE